MFCSRKNAVMTTSIASMDKHDDDDNISSVSEKMPSRGEHITILMSRGKAGYGFTVTGAYPTRVGRIVDGSTSQQSGLERDDHIIRINGQNLSRLDMNAVACVVKQCDRQMVMDVHRYTVHYPSRTCNQGVHTSAIKSIGSESGSGKSSGFSSLTDTFSDSGSDVTSYTTDNMPPALVPWKRSAQISPWQLYHQLKEQQADMVHTCDSYDSESEYSYYTDTESCLSCSTYNLDKENLTQNKMMRFSNSASKSDNITSQKTPQYAVVNKLTKRGLSCRDAESGIESDSNKPAIPPRKPPTKYKPEVEAPSTMQPPNDSQLSEDSGLDVASQLPVLYHGLSQEELEKQDTIQILLKDEIRYRDDLRYGIVNYVTPLQQGIVTDEQHTILFQNIEQICASSAALVVSLRAHYSPYTDVLQARAKHIDNIGSVLGEQIDEMCVEYERYCAGVRNSITLFMQLRKIRDFDQYLHTITHEGKPKLCEFIQKPVEHVKNMTLAVLQIYKLTDANHHDYESLQEVVRALRRCSGNISQEYIRQSQSNLTAITSRSSTFSQASNQSVASSVDSEVVDIQNRLLFGENVKTFQLTAMSRHVIYIGDLEYEIEAKWTKVYAILMNDVLLLTKKGSDNFLTVLETPLLLHDIRSCHPTDSKHPSEFQLKVECHHCEPLGFEPKFYSFRAASLEQKCVWKNLLQQRIQLLRSHKQLTVAKVAELL